jgi:hypothetical protein
VDRRLLRERGVADAPEGLSLLSRVRPALAM